jgi:hypothetical protein
MDTVDWGVLYAAYARAQEVQLEARETRWWAAKARHEAQLTLLARSMPKANRLTLTVTAVLLAQRGLLPEQRLKMPTHAAGMWTPPSVGPHPTHAPPESGPLAQSSMG